MPKPLADMTLEQRANHVGMWCDIFEQLDEPPVAEGIIAGYREDDDGRTLVIIDHPHAGAGEWVYRLNGVVPRYDLPRAWNPDGTPPRGEWEEGGYFDFTPGASPLPIQGRRWVGEWEPA